MKIGFARFTLTTSFKHNNQSQGSNHELVDIFNIFKERGHDCIMLSQNDKYEKANPNNCDIIFTFCGSLIRQKESKFQIFNKYTYPIYDLINSCNIPYIYFQTDPRSTMDITKIDIIRQPKIILTQEKNNYGHLDKIILYKKEKRKLTKKDIEIGILMNQTSESRVKQLQKIIKDRKVQYFGNIKEVNSKEIKFDEVQNILDTITFSVNIGKKETWVSQKYWEMILSNVICFYANFDKDELLMKKDDIRRVNDWLDLDINLDKIKKNYDLFLTKQYEEIKDEYRSGEFLYNLIMNKITQYV